MFELIAQGPSNNDRWRIEIKPDQSLELGREASHFKATWDGQISRRHAILTLSGDDLQVERLAAAGNPIFFGGVERDSFRVKPGEHFVIGNTTFMMTNERALPTLDLPTPLTKKSFSAEFLRSNVEYVDSDRRIKVLYGLPRIISSAGNEKELYSRLVNILMEGIPSSSTVAIFTQNESDTGSRTEVLHWDRRRLTSGDFAPSERLIRQALEEQQTVLHIWNQKGSSLGDYTLDIDNDWAFVCPLTVSTTQGWGIYVTGKNRSPASKGSAGLSGGSGEQDLNGDVKFCELIASTLQNLVEAQQLERQQASLRSFFSPIVVEAFSDRDPEEVLAPRECEVSVLFCDLRGFSKASERMAGDLLELLSRVSNSLGIMTAAILEYGGVIGDFHGDAAMGFWGWPLDQKDRACRAIEASAGIQEQFAQIASDQQHPLHDFRMGIGIATGSAVAGKIGTSDQVKVTAFGPVVNLASRLEGMSRWFGGSILIDEVTVAQVQSQPHNFHLQRLGSFLPYGLRLASTVYRLVPPELSSDLAPLETYDDALKQFEAGQWKKAGEILTDSGFSEPCSQFLLDYIWNNRDGEGPPMGFNGTIEMKSK